MSGPASYLLHSSRAADKIEVEMKLDAQEDPRKGGGGAPPGQLLPRQPPLALPLARPEGWGCGVQGRGFPLPYKGPSAAATTRILVII